MSLFGSTLIISSVMLVLCAAPIFVAQLRAHSKLLFLTGTGALLGLLLFDLVPDVIELGGHLSLLWIGVVWALYSLFHLFHIHHHEMDSGHGSFKPDGSVGVFLFAMSAHCFASGMLLAVSADYNVNFQKAVFFALLIHKIYEALTVSSIVVEKVQRRSRALVLLLPYAVSLPLGEAIAVSYRELVTPQIALIITCVATGTLFGCLYSDFILPAIPHLRARKVDAGWILGGLITTELLIKAL